MTEWISVDERLPENGTHVLAYCDVRSAYQSGGYICDAFYAEVYGVVANCDCECDIEYDENSDEYYLMQGWYEVIKNWDDYNSIAIADFVTHWMPLPEPPEAE